MVGPNSFAIVDAVAVTAMARASPFADSRTPIRAAGLRSASGHMVSDAAPP